MLGRTELKGMSFFFSPELPPFGATERDLTVSTLALNDLISL